MNKIIMIVIEIRSYLNYKQMSLFGRDHNIFAIDIICINTYMHTAY